MEAVGQGDLAAVLMRNLVISRGLCVVDTLLLALHVWEVQNFEFVIVFVVCDYLTR